MIRKARPSDAPAISALISSLAHFFTLDPGGKGAELFLSSISVGAIGRCVSSSSFDYRVGFIDGRLVGVVAIREGEHLFHLFVSPEFHRRGIARALWEHAASEAVKAGSPAGFTVNSTPFAVPIYERLGFRAVGPRTEKHGIAFVPMELRPSETGAWPFFNDT